MTTWFMGTEYLEVSPQVFEPVLPTNVTLVVDQYADVVRNKQDLSIDSSIHRQQTGLSVVQTIRGEVSLA